DVRGNDRAATRDFVADKFGDHELRNRGAEGNAFVLVEERITRSAGIVPALFFIAIAGRDARAPLPAEVLSNRDVFHLRRDDALPGIAHLGYAQAFLRAQRRTHERGKILQAIWTLGFLFLSC